VHTDNYLNFQNFVLRVPIFSLTKYRDFTYGKKILEENYRQLCHSTIFREAIFLSSPELLVEIDKWIEGNLKDQKKIRKLKETILKYFSRMSSRCTPFGLYSGCSIGEFSDKTDVLVDETKNFSRFTRLDMHFLVALGQELAKKDIIKKQLIYFPNTSLYSIGNQLRYIEYKYINKRRHHYTVAVDNTELLNEIISKSREGILYSDLICFLTEFEISIDDARDYVNELITSQFIISELEPSLTGQDFLKHIIEVLEKIEYPKETVLTLKRIKDQIKNLDQKIGNEIQGYYEVIEEIKKLNIPYDLKYIFQTDLFTKTIQCSLNKNSLNKISNAVKFLNKITLPNKESALNKFAEAFYERYETKEIPLAIALDIELGIGYLQNHKSGDVNPLIDDIMINEKGNINSYHQINWNIVNKILLQKVVQSYKEKAYIIHISDIDFKELDSNWDDLHDTMSCIVEVLKINEEERFYLKGLSGSSASNLINRFCYGNEQIRHLSQKITNLEDFLEKKIIAEIVHLPESRTGNILLRPELRKFEIPYLSMSQKKVEEQITLDDLMISVSNLKKIKLRSKKLNVEIKVALSNAHNFSHNSLPIYQFLCDLQNQDKRPGIGFYYFPNQHEFEFLPRVEYDEIVIHKATWNLKYLHVQPLINNEETDFFYNEIKNLKEKLMIPQYVVLIEGDNTLLINFENIDSVKMLLSIVKNRKSFILEEFLFDNEEIVKTKEEYFTNQIIIPFYKKLVNNDFE
jgi:hypothetical protein